MHPSRQIVAALAAGIVALQAYAQLPPPPPDSRTGRAAAPAPFRLESCQPEPCPRGFNCALWPPETSGSMTLCRSTELFRGKTLQRTFHVYTPARATGPVPLVLYLHGGAPDTTTAALDQLARGFDELADGRPARWSRNTEDCRASFPTPPPAFDQRFENAAGQPCTPFATSVRTSQPFVLVLPDGIPDDPADPQSTDGQHWEDGRVPSPGQLGDAEQRDDAGFLDHVVGVLLAGRVPEIDPERVYLTGGSNGGMMALRAACSVNNPAYPHLGQVAAFAIQVATLPEPLALGLSGRPRCARSGTEAPIAFYAGNEIPTPQCRVFPCLSPVINGDSRMPYGEPGGVYLINSPDSGRVIAAADAHRWWRDYATASGAGPGTTATAALGYFTRVRTTAFPGSQAQVVVYETAGGLHGANFGRGDYHPAARPVQFLFSFRREASGRIRFSPADALFLGDF